MSLHADLLDQAQHLARREPRRPKQASLRRAVSAAYYALFHLLVSESSSLVSPVRLRVPVGRAFAHGTMKQVCKEYARGSITNAASPSNALTVRPIQPELQRVGTAFVELQELRHAADYDLSRPFNRINVLRNIELARAAFRDWHSVRNTPNAEVFLAALLFEKSWTR